MTRDGARTADLRLFGVDFTSAPRPRKPIVVVEGRLDDKALALMAVEWFTAWPAFEAFLERPGPWIAAFDLPLGLPHGVREALSWPHDWRQLMQQLAAMPRAEYTAALDRLRQARPMGARYIHRRCDHAAGSSSPMKLVNPPVGLMLFEGAPRMARAGLSVLPCAPSADTRVAVEGYPGFVARALGVGSYKHDARAGQTPARRQERVRLVASLDEWVREQTGRRLRWTESLRSASVDDATGDTLDAVVLAAQAALAAHRIALGEAIAPPDGDPAEGWIVGVEWSQERTPSSGQNGSRPDPSHRS